MDMHNNIIKPWLAKKDPPEPVISNIGIIDPGYIYCPYIPQTYYSFHDLLNVNPMVEKLESEYSLPFEIKRIADKVAKGMAIPEPLLGDALQDIMGVPMVTEKEFNELKGMLDD